jgi:hypothetical protein
MFKIKVKQNIMFFKARVTDRLRRQKKRLKVTSVLQAMRLPVLVRTKKQRLINVERLDK